MEGSKDAIPGRSQIPSEPPITIDHTAFPHIFSRIISHSTSPSTLAALSRCSRFTRKAAIQLLYRSLRVTPVQLVTLIETGWASGQPDGSFSPDLREGLESVHTLHLLDYDDSEALPDLPSGCLGKVENIVLHLTERPRSKTITLHQTLLDLPATKLYVWVPEVQILRDPFGYMSVHQLPHHIRSVTCLVPLGYHLMSAPTFGLLSNVAELMGHTVQASVVLLPWQRGRMEADGRADSDMMDRWRQQRSIAAIDSDRYPLCLIGCEYAGIWGDPTSLVTKAAIRKPDHSQYLSFATFAEWLDALEPDTVFSREEAVELWSRDLELMGGTLDAIIDKTATTQSHHLDGIALYERQIAEATGPDLEYRKKLLNIVEDNVRKLNVDLAEMISAKEVLARRQARGSQM